VKFSIPLQFNILSVFLLVQSLGTIKSEHSSLGCYIQIQKLIKNSHYYM